jgi:hypothetical protein
MTRTDLTRDQALRLLLPDDDRGPDQPFPGGADFIAAVVAHFGFTADDYREHLNGRRSLTAQLAEECGYDPEADGSVDDLIGYKDALVDTVDRAESELVRLLAAATIEERQDAEHWERVATGQDSEEAEASGALEGRVDAYRTALKVLRGEEVPS